MNVNRQVRGAVMDGLANFNSLGGMSSEPEALLGLRVFNFLQIKP